MSINSELIKFIPPQTYYGETPIAYVKDKPQADEITKGKGFSSVSAGMDMRVLNCIDLPAEKILQTYCMNFRPDGGELSSLFWQKDLPVEGYVSWGVEKNVFLIDFAYTELVRLRSELQRGKVRFIIAAGKWALYFLTGVTTQKETAKSSFGALLTWRASHLPLADWWGMPDTLVIPILPLNAQFEIPSKAYLSKLDLKRLKRVGQAAIEGSTAFGKCIKRDERFILAPEMRDDAMFPTAREAFFHEVEHTLDWLLVLAERGKLPLAIDVETLSYSFIDCIGIAWSESEGICIPFAGRDSPHYWEEQQEAAFTDKLWHLLTHTNVQHIGQNYQYDCQYFWRNMLVKAEPAFDTMIANHSMFSVMDKNLSFLSSLYCDVHRHWKGTGAYHKGATETEHWTYNIRDCCATFEIAAKQQIMYRSAAPKWEKILARQMRTLSDIQEVTANGLDLDTKLRDRFVLDLKNRASILELKFKQGIGENINLASSQQLKELFYNLFECQKIFSDVTDEYGVTKKVLALDEEALKTHWESQILLRPFIELLLDYKKLTKSAAGLESLTLDVDGKLRCSYNVAGTDTYRFSSSSNAFGTGTNLQIISKGKYLMNGEKLPNMKKLFICPEGFTKFDIDLDSADLRIVVKESGAKDLAQMFAEGVKPYVALMQEFYHDPTKSKDSKEYGIFKSLCHGSNYIGSAKGIAAIVGLPVHEVDRVQKWYFQRNPEIKRWHVELEKQVRSRQFIENAFGYVRWFFDLRFPTLMQVATAWTPQSSVALLINEGMHRIRAEEPEIRVQMQTHDSLAGIFPTDQPHLVDRIVELCSNPIPYPEPLYIPVSIGTSTVSWGDID